MGGFSAAEVLLELLHDEAGAQFRTVRLGLPAQPGEVDGRGVDSGRSSCPAVADSELVGESPVGRLGANKAEVSVQWPSGDSGRPLTSGSREVAGETTSQRLDHQLCELGWPGLGLLLRCQPSGPRSFSRERPLPKPRVIVARTSPEVGSPRLKSPPSMSLESGAPPPIVTRRWAPDGPTVLLLAVAILGFAAFTQPQFDPDFWWHLRVGLDILASGVPQHNDYTFTAATHAFITQEWGAEAIYALLYRALGMTPVILLMALVTWIGFIFGVMRADRVGLSRWILALGAALVIISGLQIWGPSPQMFTFGLLGILLVLLDAYRLHPSRWLLLWLIPMFAVWGNLHGGFLVGVGVIAVFLVGEVISNWLKDVHSLPRGRLLDLAGGLVLSGLAPMVNPNGWGLYLYPLHLLLSPVAQANLNEWQPPNFHSLATVPVLALLLSALVGARWAKHTRPADLLLAVAGIVLLLYAVRDIPLFALMVLPLWTDGMQGIVEHVRTARKMAPGRRRRPAPRWFVGTVLLLVVLVSAVRISAQLSSPDNHLEGSVYPVQVGRIICDGPTARVFAPYGSTGWLLYRLDHRDPAGSSCAPDRLFIFGEVDLMGPKVLTQYLTVDSAAPGTMAILRHYGVSLVWQGRTAALTRLLQTKRGWTCVFANRLNVLYASPGRASAWTSSRADCPG